MQPSPTFLLFPETRQTARGALPQHVLLARLFWLRWATMGGELLVLAGARFWLQIALPMSALLAIIGLQALINLATLARMRSARPSGQGELFLQLLLDVAGLSALLYFSGGATNPFVSFYLPALAAGAATLYWLYAGGLTLCALAAYSALVYVYQPLHIHDHQQAMSYHLAGMWINFVMSALLITWFVTRIAAAVRARDTLLAQAREQHLQGQRIVALGTQAASAAHALNTPLSTVAVIAGELRRDTASNAALAAYADDVLLIEQQIAVCKQALERMRLDADAAAHPAQAVALASWLHELVEGWRLRHPATTVLTDVAALHEVRMGTAELDQILLTLLDNAAHAAGEVRVSARIEAPEGQAQAIIGIADNGPGIAPDLLARLGHGPVRSSTGGRGIGLMLAFAAAGQIGARLRLHSAGGQGTVAELSLPLPPLTGGGERRA